MSTTGSGTPTTTSLFFTNNPTSATSTPGSSSTFGNSSTPLYLFTFLATLLVLLAVSCAIVLRSFYLRRQMRRRYEAAIAAGIISPTAMPGRRRRREVGEKPKLYDTAIMPVQRQGEKWEYVIPVAAKISEIPSHTQSIPSSPTSPSPQQSRFSTLTDTLKRIPPFRRPRPPLSPPTTTDAISAPVDPLADASNVQVAVLIAMPHPHAMEMQGKGKGRMADSGYWDEEEEGVPDVAIGVSQLKLMKP